MPLKPFTNYECASGLIGGHTGLYTGAHQQPSKRDETCICGQPMVEVVPDGYRYKVEFETISPHQAAEMEAMYGRDIWPKLNDVEWNALQWHPVTNEQGSPNSMRDQYKRLLMWAETREQPIRNVKFLRSQTSEWEEVAV